MLDVDDERTTTTTAKKKTSKRSKKTKKKDECEIDAQRGAKRKKKEIKTKPPVAVARGLEEGSRGVFLILFWNFSIRFLLFFYRIKETSHNSSWLSHRREYFERHLTGLSLAADVHLFFPFLFEPSVHRLGFSIFFKKKAHVRPPCCSRAYLDRVLPSFTEFLLESTWNWMGSHWWLQTVVVFFNEQLGFTLFRRERPALFQVDLMITVMMMPSYLNVVGECTIDWESPNDYQR